MKLRVLGLSAVLIGLLLSPGAVFGGKYSSGSSSPSSGGMSRSAPAMSSPARPSSPYSSGSYQSTPNPGKYSSGSTPTPSKSAPAYIEPKSTFGSGQSSQMQTSESRAAYEAAHPTPKVERSNSAPSATNRQLQLDLSRAQRENRALRQQQQLGAADNSRPPTVVYRDLYDWRFMNQLQMMSLQYQALWYFNHANDMDQQRYNSAMADNAALAAQVAALKAQGLKVDPNYTPPDIDRDVMYTDDAVSADGSSTLWKIPLFILCLGGAVILIGMIYIYIR